MSEDRSDSFAAMFEQSNVKKGRSLRIGERLEGTVILVGKDAVFIEVDGKREAFIEAAELRAPDGTLSIKVGDTLAAQVVQIDEATGQVRLGRSFAGTGDVASLERARAAGVAIEGKVTGINKGGLEVDVAGHRAFCPMSQVDRKPGGDHAGLVGKTFSFLVTEVRDGGRNVVVSRRAVLEREASEAAKKTIDALDAGSIIRGTVTAVRDFGAFVDLGGFEGLIPTSEMKRDKSQQLSPGDNVEVVVREIKPPERPGATPKVTLSFSSLGAAPEGAAVRVVAKEAGPVIGAIVHGKVEKIETYGVFVQIDGTTGRSGRGLIPMAELGVPRGADLRRTFPEGTPVVAKVLETGDRKLRLSIKAAKDHEERAQFEEAKSIAGAPKSFGTFGDLLKKRGR